MREIKFRAWDKQHNCFTKYPFVISNEGLVFKEYVGGGKIEKYYEIMQFTGLPDKNGKEIYEGDIVKFMYLNVDVPEERVMPVELVGLGDDMKVRIITAYSPFCYTTGGGYRDKGRETVDCYLTPPSDCEIIGNIYENPELLK